MKHPLLGKLFAVGAVIAILLVALQSVAGLVSERQARQREAEQSIADSLAGRQAILGPVLQVRCDETWEQTEGEGKNLRTSQRHRDVARTIWPRTIDADAEVRVDPRHRGLFKVNGYLVREDIVATWDPLVPPKPDPGEAGHRFACRLQAVGVSVSDSRGIQKAIVRIGGQVLPSLPASLLVSQPAGFHVDLNREPGAEALVVQIALELAGTASVSWAPVADQTRMHLKSDWPHPSFGGRFLPRERTLRGDGFEASWQVSGLATTARDAAEHHLGPCAWHAESMPGDTTSDAARPGCVDTFGVGLLDPVNGYVLNDRALKYGFLFIALTFVAVALIETTRRVRVHPIQYLLVGSALAVFFLLLLGLTEHLAFLRAYACASGACTALLVYYAAFVLRSVRLGAAFGVAVAGLYGALYVLLQMEQVALVLGSVLLFLVLAATMVATRRMDWYAFSRRMREDSAAEAAA